MPEQPTPEETQRWQKRFAIQANNRAWESAELETRTAAESAEMLDAAHAARHLWGKVGNEKNIALADLLLGQVHALLGCGESALSYAEAAFAPLSSATNAVWEQAFAHAILSHAAAVAGKRELHHTHYALAASLAETMTDPEDRKIFDATFRFIPRP